MNLIEARARWQAHRGMLAEKGLVVPMVSSYMPEAAKRNFHIVMDAQPGLSTDPNSAIPAMLTTTIDPEVIKILFATNEAANIMGERKLGDWTAQTHMLPVTEATGEVSSYGDYNNNGTAGLNMNFPQVQAYLFQLIKSYGELQLDRAGLAKISYVSELDQSAAFVMNKFMNLTYFFGLQGLQQYGLINNPFLAASITPAVKAWGGVTWYNNGVPAATANEVFADIQALVNKLVTQTNGLVNLKTKMTLAMSPSSMLGLTFVNSFGVSVEDLMKKTFPNITVKDAVQYGVITASNPQGSAGGNLMQLIADSIEGQKTGYCAFNEKMRAHKIIAERSAWSQKVTGGTWGTVIRMPVAITSMIGI